MHSVRSEPGKTQIVGRHPEGENPCNLATGLYGTPPPHARAVAEELLDLALVAVRPAGRVLEERPRALPLGVLDHRLPARVAEGVPGGLELAVVEPAAVLELVEHLPGHAHA